MAKSENTPSAETIKAGETIELTTRFGGLSRGKCWGKYYANKTGPVGDFEWCAKEGGTLFLTGPGYYVVGSGDGFSREARGCFVLRAATKADEIAELSASIARSKEKDPEGEVTLTVQTGDLSPGKHKRALVIAEREKILAKLKA